MDFNAYYDGYSFLLSNTLFLILSREIYHHIKLNPGEFTTSDTLFFLVSLQTEIDSPFNLTYSV